MNRKVAIGEDSITFYVYRVSDTWWACKYNVHYEGIGFGFNSESAKHWFYSYDAAVYSCMYDLKEEVYSSGWEQTEFWKRFFNYNEFDIITWVRIQLLHKN